MSHHVAWAVSRVAPCMDRMHGACKVYACPSGDSMRLHSAWMECTSCCTSCPMLTARIPGPGVPS
eukprot:52769-Chlamydomonas_euryale.AAC.1